MASRNSRIAVPEARTALEQFKNEVASSMNINLQNGYNGDIAARDAGRIGGQMVKRMIEYAENNMNGSMNSMNNSNSGSNNMMR